VVASQRTRVRLGCLAGSRAAPGHEQDDRLVRQASLRGQGEKAPRLADLLDVDRERADLLIGNERLHHVFGADGDFIAGGEHTRHGHATAPQRVTQVGGHKAALRHDAHAGAGFPITRGEGFERDGNTRGQIAETHAVGADQGNTGLLGYATQFGLPGLPFLAGLGIARSEQDRRLAPPSRERFDCVKHTGFWNGQHGQVDVQGQLVDGFDARTAVDLGAPATDQMQHARISKAFQGALHKAAKRTGVGRGTHHGNGLGAQDALHDGSRSAVESIEAHSEQPFNR
jgi:hypothetical protein